MIVDLRHPALKYHWMSVGHRPTKRFGSVRLSLALRYARLWRDTKAASRRPE